MEEKEAVSPLLHARGTISTDPSNTLLPHFEAGVQSNQLPDAIGDILNAVIPNQPNSNASLTEEHGGQNNEESRGGMSRDWSELCSICFDNTCDFSLPRCQDQFCRPCIRRYFSEKIQSCWGVSTLRLSCPVCNDPVSIEFVSRFVDEKLARICAEKKNQQRNLSRHCPECQVEVLASSGPPLCIEERARRRKSFDKKLCSLFNDQQLVVEVQVLSTTYERGGLDPESYLRRFLALCHRHMTLSLNNPMQKGQQGSTALASYQSDTTNENIAAGTERAVATKNEYEAVTDSTGKHGQPQDQSTIENHPRPLNLIVAHVTQPALPSTLHAVHNKHNTKNITRHTTESRQPAIYNATNEGSHGGQCRQQGRGVPFDWASLDSYWDDKPIPSSLVEWAQLLASQCTQTEKRLALQFCLAVIFAQWTCSVCGCRFCFRCGVAAWHEGLTCLQYMRLQVREVRQMLREQAQSSATAHASGDREDDVCCSGLNTDKATAASGKRKRKQSSLTLTAEDADSLEWKLQNSQCCPNCHIFIEREDGCNRMTCPYCSYEFCWRCLRAWSAKCGFYSCSQSQDDTPTATEHPHKKAKVELGVPDVGAIRFG